MNVSGLAIQWFRRVVECIICLKRPLNLFSIFLLHVLLVTSVLMPDLQDALLIPVLILVAF
jgi:hypothetical protein